MRTRARERRWVPSHHPEHDIHRKTESPPEVKWSDNLQSCYGNDSCDGARLLEQLAQYRPVADRFVIAVSLSFRPLRSIVTFALGSDPGVRSLSLTNARRRLPSDSSASCP